MSFECFEVVACGKLEEIAFIGEIHLCHWPEAIVEHASLADMFPHLGGFIGIGSCEDLGCSFEIWENDSISVVHVARTASAKRVV